MVFRQIALVLALIMAFASPVMAQQHDHQHGSDPFGEMQQKMDSAESATDPSERKALMQEHMAMMQSMHGMMGSEGGMMGGDMQGQMHQMREHMAMMQKMMEQMMGQQKMMMDMPAEKAGDE